MKKIVSIIVIIMLTVASAAVMCAYTMAQKQKVEVVRAGTLMNQYVAQTRAKGDVVALDNHNETRTKKPEDTNAWRTGNGYIDSQHRFVGTAAEISMFLATHPEVEIHWVNEETNVEGISTYHGNIMCGWTHTRYTNWQNW